MDTLTQQMIAGNTLAVDTVAGATYTSKGFLEAVNDALAKSGATAADLVANEVAQGAQQRESEYTADVLVVGGGGAGLTAAIEAADAGANVMLIEKMPRVGGNTLISGAEYAAPGN